MRLLGQSGRLERVHPASDPERRELLKGKIVVLAAGAGHTARTARRHFAPLRSDLERLGVTVTSKEIVLPRGGFQPMSANLAHVDAKLEQDLEDYGADQAILIAHSASADVAAHGLASKKWDPAVRRLVALDPQLEPLSDQTRHLVQGGLTVAKYFLGLDVDPACMGEFNAFSAETRELIAAYPNIPLDIIGTGLPALNMGQYGDTRRYYLGPTRHPSVGTDVPYIETLDAISHRAAVTHTMARQLTTALVAESLGLPPETAPFPAMTPALAPALPKARGLVA